MPEAVEPVQAVLEAVEPLQVVPEAVEPGLAVRLAQTDQDAAAIHAFLCEAAARAGALRCPVNAEKSMNE
ncbi:MAG: hypothetical protein ABSG76_23820, partial [Xanthobacteraceae bacterium]